MSLFFNILVEKVILMICGPCSLLSERDEAIFSQTVGAVLRDTGKGFVVWLKDNQIAVESDILLQMILSRPVSSLNTQPQRSFSAGDFSPSTNASNVTTGRKVQSPPGYHMTSHQLLERHDVPLRQEHTFNQLHQTLPKQTPDPPSGREYVPPVRGFVMLKTRLFSGSISYRQSDIEIFLPGFEVPDELKSTLQETYLNTPEAMVKITWEGSDQLGFFVEPISKAKEKEEKSLQLKENETVMLITCVRHGRISMEEGDLEFIYPQWNTPEDIADHLKDKYWARPRVQLCVISDGKGNLRVQERLKIQYRFLGKFNKFNKKQEKHFSAKCKGYCEVQECKNVEKKLTHLTAPVARLG